MEHQRVWVPDPAEGFVVGKIIDIGLDEVTVQPLDTKKPKQTCSLDRLYTAEEHDNKDVEDNCKFISIILIYPYIILLLLLLQLPLLPPSPH